MTCSLARREAIPASARNFCKRTMQGAVEAPSARNGLSGLAPGSSPLELRSRIGLGFAQTGNTVAVLPLPPFLEQFRALKSLEHIPFAAQFGGGAKTPVL